MVFNALVILGMAIPAAYLLTGWARDYAVRNGVLDVPNARSSHPKATPRGGGLAIAFVLLAGTTLLGLSGLAPRRLVVAIAGGGLLVAAVGWFDDRSSRPVALRVFTHLAAAAWAVFWLGGLPTLRLGNNLLRLGVLGDLMAVLAIAWLVNLYNFMDGIDGLAASEAVAVAATAGVLLATGGDTGLATVSLLIAGAAVGFLAWNLPPAKVFMGDVGSGLLGYVFGVSALYSERSGSLPALIWVLLLGVFIVDATATLIRRVLRGERWFEAHRSHAYQMLTRTGLTHGGMTGLVVAVDSLLAFLAWLCIRYPNAVLAIEAAALSCLALVWLILTERVLTGSGKSSALASNRPDPKIPGPRG